MNVGMTGGTIGKEEFLLLFTSQLRNQDPLKPMDSTDFTAQLAQFSSLEQLFNMNQEMTRLVAYQNSLNNGMAIEFIGKKVITHDGLSGTVQGISFEADGTHLKLDTGEDVMLAGIKEIYSQ